jgi:hypothetical protein
MLEVSRDAAAAGEEQLVSWLATKLACGSMLKVSRDVVAAGEEQLVSFAAEQSKYCSICTATLDPYGDLPFTSLCRW